MTNRTLYFYLAGIWLRHFLILLGLLLLIVYLFDTVELLRRAGDKEGVGLGLVLKMGLLKLPEVGQIILPFAVLFSGLFTFWQLNRRQELVIIRAAGQSAKHFLLPFFLAAFMIGVIHVTIVNPIGALLLSRFETYEAQYLNKQKSLVSLFKQGIWLRQDYARGNGENAELVLHARKIKLPEWELDKIMILAFDDQGKYRQRLDADTAWLEEKAWRLQNVTLHQRGHESRHVPELTLPTNITRNDIENSFAEPETVMFWKLPTYIAMLEATGFDATAMRMHYYSLLTIPFLFIAMVLLAACLSLRPPRQGGAAAFAGAGIAIGIIIFFFSNFLQALGVSHQLPPLLAAMAPPAVSLLAGFGILLHLEDG